MRAGSASSPRVEVGGSKPFGFRDRSGGQRTSSARIGKVITMTQVAPHSVVDHAQLGVGYARIALGDAEGDGATIEEVLQLCGEVIARRLRFDVYRMRAGWRPPSAVRTQMLRDRALLQIPAASMVGRFSAGLA